MGLRYCGRAYRIDDLGRIGALGLDCAEINLLEGGRRFLQPRRLVQQASRWNLTYLVHAPKEGDPCDVQRLGKYFSKQIREMIRICAEISAPLLTVHFWIDRRFIPEPVVRQKCEILSELARDGARNGVQICLENLSEDPDDLSPLLLDCPELGITLDIGHGQLLARRNRGLDLIRRWPARIRHVHVHDNRGGNRVEDDLHLPIGAGIIDFPLIFKALIETGYQGTVTPEVPLDHLEASLQRLRAILGPLIREAR